MDQASMTVLAAATAEDVLAAVEWAVAEKAPLEIVGHGTKRGIGRPLRVGHVLDLSKVEGVTLYEPEELVLSARAGTPVDAIEAMLAEKGQQLAFEPMDYRRLLGGSAVSARAGTLGGMLAGNLAGPRRIKAGAARDHVLGVTAVSGRGEMFRSGGRVVKNVTGYDLAKLMAGSWGTLAVVTEMTFKVLPVAETETTMAIRGLTDAEAAAAMALAMGSSADVSGAAHLPVGVALRVAEGSLGSDPATLRRVEGFGPSVADRIGPKPSTRSSVAGSLPSKPSATRRATPSGRCAAPETSALLPMASAIAAAASASVSPLIAIVVSVSAAGSTLKVTSVTTASVPQDPAISLARS